MSCISVTYLFVSEGLDLKSVFYHQLTPRVAWWSFWSGCNDQAVLWSAVAAPELAASGSGHCDHQAEGQDHGQNQLHLGGVFGMLSTELKDWLTFKTINFCFYSFWVEYIPVSSHLTKAIQRLTTRKLCRKALFLKEWYVSHGKARMYEAWGSLF